MKEQYFEVVGLKRRYSSMKAAMEAAFSRAKRTHAAAYIRLHPFPWCCWRCHTWRMITPCDSAEVEDYEKVLMLNA